MVENITRFYEKKNNFCEIFEDFFVVRFCNILNAKIFNTTFMYFLFEIQYLLTLKILVLIFSYF